MCDGVQPELQNSDDVDISNKNSIEQECVEDCPWPERTVLILFVAERSSAIELLALGRVTTSCVKPNPHEDIIIAKWRLN